MKAQNRREMGATPIRSPNQIAERSGLNNKDVAAVLDALAATIGETICDGYTPFTIPGICKIVPEIWPATEARFGVPNPFRPGETMDVAAEPERRIVKVRPLEGLKDMVAGGAPAAPAAVEEAPAAAEATDSDEPAPRGTQVLNPLAEKSGLNKKDVAAVLDALAFVIGVTICDGYTPFTIPGICKIVPEIWPATEAHFGVPNPFRPGETMDVAAEPERTMLKIHPLKGLKDMVADSAPTEAEATDPDEPATAE
jgi:nucleoid DNA-binding protein